MKLSQPVVELNPLHKLIVKLAGRPGGLNNSELRDAAGITSAQAASALHCSALRGRTRSVEHPDDKDHRRRYFVSRDDAEAWQAGPAPARVRYACRPGWPAEQRQHTAGASKMAAKSASEPLVPTSRGASPVLGIALRYYVDPASVPQFFSATLIGINPVTGQAWGAAAS